MALFKKQRKRFQEWLNSFVVKHHEDWWMPLFTIALGISYVCVGVGFIAVIGSTIVGLAMLGNTGAWIAGIIAAITLVYYIGMIARVPGDNEWERRQRK